MRSPRAFREAVLYRLPAPVRRLLRGGLADKYAEELRWQRDEWVPLWRQQATQEKCLEYWRRYRHLDDIRALVPIGEDTDVLDVGCGISSVLHFLPGRRVGVDPLASRYRRIYDYPFPIQDAPGEHLSFPDQSFDVVFCSNVIDHVSDPDVVMEEIGRVLRPGGHLVITCDVVPEGPRRKGSLAHPQVFGSADFRALVARHFTIEAEWDEPWYGMQHYVLGHGPTADREVILVAAALVQR